MLAGQEVLSRFLDALGAAGLQPVTAEVIPDGRLHRFQVEGDRHGKRNGWYVLHADGRVPGGAFGSWRTGQAGTWSAKGEAEFDAAEREEWRQRQAAIRAQRELDMEQTAARAQRIWAGLPDRGASPYLDRKRVRAYGIRFARGAIVIPVRDLDDKLWGLQFIGPDGLKRFLTGTPKRGRFHRIGQPGDVLAVAEGYATAASIHMATGWETVVAFDAGNLLPVALALRKRCPRIRLVICGDDDVDTPGNPGRTQALAAAAAVGGEARFPSDGAG